MAFGEDIFGFEAARILLEQIKRDGLYDNFFVGYDANSFYRGLMQKNGILVGKQGIDAVRAHSIVQGPDKGKLTLELRVGFEEVDGKIKPIWKRDYSIKPVDHKNITSQHLDLATAVNAVYR